MGAENDWDTLLCAERLQRGSTPTSRSRSPFQQDADLVVFSGAFRRLQDKTQVHPLAGRGKVRTRLTHSIEVASVGRSLGLSVGLSLLDRGDISREQADAISHTVYAACLAHDIGNPPFGHAGEDAIGAWFQSHPHVLDGLAGRSRRDLCRFEGNAQGLRILTQLENYRGAGGLRLTYATLGAFMKYTVGVDEVAPDGPAGARKPGFFESERAYVEGLRARLGLAAGQRHALAFLTEAADDICYAVIDVEDGHVMGLIDHAEAREVLSNVAQAHADPTLPPHAQLQKLRGIAIGRLIHQVATRFVESERELRDGSRAEPLLAGIEQGADVAAAKALSARRVFHAPTVVDLQHEGVRALQGLLDALVPDVLSLTAGVESTRSRAARARLSRLSDEPMPEGLDRGAALRELVDRLAALTDEHALSLRRELAAPG